MPARVQVLQVKVTVMEDDFSCFEHGQAQSACAAISLSGGG